MNNTHSRRSFLRFLGLAAATLVVSPLVHLNQTLADLVNPSTDQLAKALGYVHDAKAAKDRKDKKATCASCQFYGDATGKAKTAKCQLIPTGDVKAEGWCRSYSARPKKKA